MTFARKTPGFGGIKTPRVRSYPSAIPLAQRRNAVFARMDVMAAPPQAKDAPVQNKAYMDAVRSLPCAHCGKGPRSVFCHSDQGKGMGIKSDCRDGWPGCHDCHDAIGTQRIYDKGVRRVIEADMARRTRAQVEAMGLWPAGLERWIE